LTQYFLRLVLLSDTIRNLPTHTVHQYLTNIIQYQHGPLRACGTIQSQQPSARSILSSITDTGSTQPGHPFVGRRNEYQPKGDDALWLGSKDRYGACVGGR